MYINTNTMFNNLSIVNRINSYRTNLEKTTERLSTGLAINSAADSPSDILRISRMQSQIIGSHAAQRNIQDALSLTQVMESAFTQMYDIGLRMKELSMLYNNSTATAEEKGLIEKESTELLKEMKLIIDTTAYGGINVFQQDQFYFQVGYSVSDSITIGNPLITNQAATNSGSISLASNTKAVSTAETNALASKDYDISVKLPDGETLSGKIKLSMSDVEQGKDIDFTISTSNGDVSKGKLRFVDVNTGRFELHVHTKGTHGTNQNIKYTGTLVLKSNANRTDLSGEGIYTLDTEFGGLTGKVTFTMQGQEPADPVDPAHPSNPSTPNPSVAPGSIDFGNIDKIPVKTLLTGDFIDKNILVSMAGFKTSIGIDRNILEFRLSRQKETETNMTSALSKVQDADMAQELLNKLKHDLLLQTNIQLLTQNMEDQRNYVLKLLEYRD